MGSGFESRGVYFDSVLPPTEGILIPGDSGFGGDIACAKMHITRILVIVEFVQ
ncbi:MAG: hypothetical protein KF844_07835 [Cryobacterium sp.]|nr:hypothetical protein [Cryobacterium sp.]